jgi:hypothetical protein
VNLAELPDDKSRPRRIAICRHKRRHRHCAFITSAATIAIGHPSLPPPRHHHHHCHHCHCCCTRGPVGGYPLSGLHVTVTAVRRDADTSPGALRYAAASIVPAAAAAADAALLEPVMAVEVAVPPVHLGSVLSDLTTHR